MYRLKAAIVASILSASLFAIVSGMAQPGAADSQAIAALDASAKTRVSWNFAKAKTADVTCDGKPDRVLFGVSAGKVWMGMLPGGSGKPQTMAFLQSAAVQEAMCAKPKRVEVYPLTCETDAVGKLDGCKQVKSCKEFAIVDDECDSLHFYWDSSQKMLSWWRA